MKNRFTSTSATAVFEMTKHRANRFEWRWWSWVNRLLNSKLSRCPLMHTESSSFHLVVSRNELSILLLPCTTEAYPFVTLCHKQMSCCHIVPRTVVLLPLWATNSCFVATLRTVVLLPICATNSYPVATWCHTERTVLLPPGATTNALCCRVMANELYELCASCSLIPNTQLWLSLV